MTKVMSIGINFWTYNLIKTLEMDSARAPSVIVYE